MSVSITGFLVLNSHYQVSISSVHDAQLSPSASYLMVSCQYLICVYDTVNAFVLLTWQCHISISSVFMTVYAFLLLIWQYHVSILCSRCTVNAFLLLIWRCHVSILSVFMIHCKRLSASYLKVSRLHLMCSWCTFNTFLLLIWRCHISISCDHDADITFCFLSDGVP